MNASLQGLSTIRAFNAEEMLEKEFHEFQDHNTSALYLFQCASRWFAVWLDVVCLLFITFVTYSFLILKDCKPILKILPVFFYFSYFSYFSYFPFFPDFFWFFLIFPILSIYKICLKALRKCCPSIWVMKSPISTFLNQISSYFNL